MRISRYTLLCAIGVLLIDQLSKWWLVMEFSLGDRPPLALTPFFNLVMVWNYGVSFGMFSAMDAKWFLIALSVAVSVALLYWSKSATTQLHKAAYGLVVGGAIGNVIDRLHYGAVADFFDFHISGWHYPAFNVADAAIVCGVIGLMWCELRKKPKNQD